MNNEERFASILQGRDWKGNARDNKSTPYTTAARGSQHRRPNATPGGASSNAPRYLHGRGQEEDKRRRVTWEGRQFTVIIHVQWLYCSLIHCVIHYFTRDQG